MQKYSFFEAHAFQTVAIWPLFANLVTYNIAYSRVMGGIIGYSRFPLRLNIGVLRVVVA